MERQVEVKRRFYRRPGCLATLVLLLLGLGYFVWVAIIDVCPYWEFYDDGLQLSIIEEGPSPAPVEFREIRMDETPRSQWYCPEELDRLPLVYSSTDQQDITEFLAALAMQSTTMPTGALQEYALLVVAQNGTKTSFKLVIHPTVVQVWGLWTRADPHSKYSGWSTALLDVMKQRGILAPSGKPHPPDKRP